MATTRFNYLNVPDHWETYWSKYPEGYTILEALIQWVQQVDSMVANINDWNTYLDNFTKQFDKELQKTVADMLNAWKDSGFLADIINNEVFGRKADQDGLYVSAKRFGVKADGVTDDTLAWQAAIDSRLPLAMGQGEHVISASLKVYPDTKIKGLGMYNSVFRPKGSFTLFDGTSPEALQEVTFKDFAVIGENTPGSKAFDLYYFVNNSILDNVRVEFMDIPLKLVKSWYAQFQRLRFRNNLSYNVELQAPSTSEQLNALVFDRCSFMMADHNIFIHGNAPSSSITFSGCTIEASRKTAVISRIASPLVFENCYFEKNYTDATLTEKLRWDTPIDILVDTYLVRDIVKISGCYFSRSDKFIASSEKTSIYVGLNGRISVDNTIFQCNTSAYIDADIYSISTKPPFIRNISRDGYATQLYIGVKNEYMVAYGLDKNLRYTSTAEFKFVALETGTYQFKMIPQISMNNLNGVAWRLRDVLAGTTLTEGQFPTNLIANTPSTFRLGNVPKNKVLMLQTTTTAGVEVDIPVLFMVYREEVY